MHMNELSQNLSIHFDTSLFSHTKSAPYSIFLHPSFLFTPHISREHFISITSWMWVPSTLIHVISDRYTTSGIAAISHNYLLTPKLTLIRMKILLFAPKVFSLARSHFLVPLKNSSFVKQFLNYMKETTNFIFISSFILATPSSIPFIFT